MDTMFQIRLRSWWDFRDEFLRIPWDPLYQEDPLWWSLAIQQREGRRSFSPSARLELLLGRVRRQLGRPCRGNPSVRVLGFQAKKGILHQPQGDDGSPGWLIRVQLSYQRQEDRSLLRLYHDSRLPQAIGRHEVSYTRRWSRTFFANGQRFIVPVRYTAVSKAPCVLCYSVAFLQYWDYLRTYAFPPITLITSFLFSN